MLVAISGSQGSGKTTVLNEIEKLGFKIVKRKTARTVMADDFPGMTLDDIYADPAVSVKWQDAILRLKYQDEREALESRELWFTERTYADLFTYAVMAVGKNNECNAWLNKYYEECKYRCSKYLWTFYLTGGHFNPVADGVRGINKHYQAMIDDTMTRVTCDMMSITPNMPEKLSYITTANVDERVDFVVTNSVRSYLDAHKKLKNDDGE